MPSTETNADEKTEPENPSVKPPRKKPGKSKTDSQIKISVFKRFESDLK